jgi:hypothetical protein
MPKKEPLYPHIPKSRNTALRVPRQSEDISLRFLPDSPELLTESINGTGLRTKLERAFLQAIGRARAKS